MLVTLDSNSKSLNPFTLEEIREYVDSIKEFMLVSSKKDS